MSLTKESEMLPHKLTPLQLELVKMFPYKIEDKELEEIKEILFKYFSSKTIALADSEWDKRSYTNKTMEDWLFEEDQ